MQNIGKLALLVAMAGIVFVALMLFGARLGIWEPIDGAALFRSYLNPLGIFIAVLGLMAIIAHVMHKEKTKALAGVVALVVGLDFLSPLIARTLNPTPRAHPTNDITTDTTNPPMFGVIDETRDGARTSLDYGGSEIAAMQAKGYPDIAPLETSMTPDTAFERPLAVASKMGWQIIASDPKRHRFEATARTLVFYFTDDIVWS